MSTIFQKKQLHLDYYYISDLYQLISRVQTLTSQLCIDPLWASYLTLFVLNTSDSGSYILLYQIVIFLCVHQFRKRNRIDFQLLQTYHQSRFKTCGWTLKGGFKYLWYACYTRLQVSTKTSSSELDQSLCLVFYLAVFHTCHTYHHDLLHFLLCQIWKTVKF